MTIPEKRRSQRSDLTTSCNSEFLYAGKKHSATMIDLSEHGARFAMEKLSDQTEFAVGDELTLLVVTPYGISQCSATIVMKKMKLN
ncbi:MAG: PilZ domain-containing protein [Chitinivibrionales bacterium]